MSSEKVKCLNCKEAFDLEEDIEIGDVTCCPGCYIRLRVLSFNPVKVEEADEDEYFEEDEEYKDDDQDDEY